MSPLALSLRFLQAQPDAKLVALARAGNERAFEALVRRHRRPLLNYSRRLASPRANAEDALQQALLQAWVALNGGLEVRDVRAWLYRIVHNVAVSSARRQDQPGGQLHEAARAAGAEDEADRRMAVRDALAGLAALPELQREVMVSTAVDGLSHAEIARELGLSSGAVRGLIYRARSTLRAAAAVFIPAPLVDWAARQAAVPSGLYGTIAGGGGGSLELGQMLVKGGAIAATAAALATAAGVSGHRGGGRSAHPGAPAFVSVGGRAGSPRHAAAAPARPEAAILVASVSTPRLGGHLRIATSANPSRPAVGGLRAVPAQPGTPGPPSEHGQSGREGSRSGGDGRGHGGNGDGDGEHAAGNSQPRSSASGAEPSGRDSHGDGSASVTRDGHGGRDSGPSPSEGGASPRAGGAGRADSSAPSPSQPSDHASSPEAAAAAPVTTASAVRETRHVSGDAPTPGLSY